jgi:hypothetical protein
MHVLKTTVLIRLEGIYGLGILESLAANAFVTFLDNCINRPEADPY